MAIFPKHSATNYILPFKKGGKGGIVEKILNQTKSKNQLVEL